MKKLFTGLGLLIVALIVVLLVLNAYPTTPDAEMPDLQNQEEQSEMEMPEIIRDLGDVDNQAPVGGLVGGADTSIQTNTQGMPVGDTHASDECGISMEGGSCNDVADGSSVDGTQEPAQKVFVAEGCQVTGCSGYICANAGQDIITTCEYKDSYACYNPNKTDCSQNLEGQCEWNETPELAACLANPPVLN